MAHACQSKLLEVCQEVRDAIFQQAIEQDVRDSAAPTDLNTSSVQAQQSQWTLHYERTAPAPVYLNIVSTNRQLYQEIHTYMARSIHACPPAEMVLSAAYPQATAAWSRMSCPPEHIRDLILRVKLSNLFDPALSTTTGQHDILLRPIYEVLKRFTTHGSFLAREKPLVQGLKLRTASIVIGSAIPLADMIYVYGSPQAQIDMLHDRLKPLLTRLAGSGVLAGIVDKELELCNEGTEPVRIPVSAELWNEVEYVHFRSLGFE